MQQRLHMLYTQGVKQMGQEKWKAAITTFMKLQEEAPGYEDVETRLAMARHMGRMFSLLEDARGLLRDELFASCNIGSIKQNGKNNFIWTFSTYFPGLYEVQIIFFDIYGEYKIMEFIIDVKPWWSY